MLVDHLIITNISTYCVYIPAPPSTELYFTLKDTVHLSGDNILIGSGNNNRSDPWSSLVCDLITYIFFP